MFLDKTKLPMVAMDFMNNTHLEEVELINRVVDTIESTQAGASSDELEALLDEFHSHTINHFEVENVHMQKYNFFAADCHMGEHTRALAELESVIRAYKDTKDIKPLEHYFKVTLIEWVMNHISTMDNVTAQFLSQFAQQR
jgi:hemerythrin